MTILHAFAHSIKPAPLYLDTPEDRERVLAKLDLLNIVEHVGIEGARELLPNLGMVQHFGLEAVTVWLDAMAKDTRRR